MNFKKLLLPTSLAFITIWAVQYFIVNPYFGLDANNVGVIKSGQTFMAPQNQAEAQPLNKEVNFIDSELANASNAQEALIEADHATYLFSSKGACLEQLIFKRVMNGKLEQLQTVQVPQESMRENRCFLVALNERTPYTYTFVEQKQLEGATQLVYKAETNQAVIEKIFTIFKSKFQIDLTVKIIPKIEGLRARIFYGAPIIPGVKDDVISAIHNAATGKIEKDPRSKLDMNKGWFAPTFFGSQDRYFVHALVADPQRFAQRAYYSLIGQSELISILESGLITAPTEWTLSYYFGPKEDEYMNVVDPRLEQTLDYSGWLAPLSRLLLAFLKYLYSFVHNYGWAIILMTLLINLVLLPLNIKSAQSMKKYAEFQKKMKYIEARYKDDPDTLARERSQMLGKHGMPGVGGCLVKLLQLPIFFALNRVLSSSIELYKAPFLWMRDLSAKDPYYILPLLIMGAMVGLTTTNADPKQRFMMIGVGLIFGAFAANFSAGLCLYILIGVVLSGIQNFVQQKMNWA